MFCRPFSPGVAIPLATTRADMCRSLRASWMLKWLLCVGGEQVMGGCGKWVVVRSVCVI